MLRATPQERQALGITALLLVAGAGVRIFSAPTGGVEWEGGATDTLMVSGLGAVREGAAEELKQARIRSQPLASGERLDPNRADVLQLDRLPKVGPSLAERIVAWRDEHGPFRSLADFDAVPGVGPALLESVEPYLSLPAVAATRQARAGSPLVGGGKVDLNRASEVELDALPGIGPTLASRIVASRRDAGPFRSVEELERVAGIGPALLERLTPLLRVTP